VLLVIVAGLYAAAWLLTRFRLSDVNSSADQTFL
jgi:hypothetical protein